MLVRAVSITAMLVAGCGKKKEQTATTGSGSATAPAAQDATAAEPVADAAAAVAEATTDAATATGGANISIANGVATVSVPRMYVEGKPHVKLTFKVPDGWQPYERSYDNRVKLVPATAQADRPSMDVEVYMDNLDEAKVAKEIDAEVKKKSKEVVGGGKVKVLATKPRPDGKLLSIAVDAQKERSVVYVQTLCFVGKHGQKFVVRIDGFAEKKDDKLVSTFEDTCTSLQIVEP